MVRPTTDEDIGMKLLRAAPIEAAETVDIVAIHGIGAHPDDTWCKNVGTAENPKWVNWLVKENMLPAVAAHARIMRYGYQSRWFGEGAIRQNVSAVAHRLLLALRRERKGNPFRPLLFIAHCFGGLVVLKALLHARQDEKQGPGVFVSTTGIIFFGTPFRGAEGMSQVEMLAAAQQEYQLDDIQPEVLKILEPGNEFLQDLVDQFGKTREQANNAQVACFYELKPSNIGRIVGKTDRTRFVVSESSGCLDMSDATHKYSLSRSHFDMNKFGKPTEEDFEIVSDVIQEMIRASARLMQSRSQYVGKHKIDFSLRGMPVISRFVTRDVEMQKLERLLDTEATARRRNVVILYGLGGIGKTQLAVEYGRNHKDIFSAIFWLDGSSKASLKQSFVGMAKRLPRDELTADGVDTLNDSTIDVDMAVRECLHWLSLSSNRRWLLIIDNVDRDHRDRSDAQAYDIKEYFPHADHGSILITSRLSILQTHGIGIKVGTVATEQACAILEANVGGAVDDAGVVLELLHGLPLALTQAGSYMREANVSASTYAKHYNQTWGRLMERQDNFLLESGDQSVLTTWTVSYERAQRQSEEAAWLLKLWGVLDNGELWYELIAAFLKAEQILVPIWLFNIAEDELEFSETMGLLCRYSLADAMPGTSSYSMHSVLHRWCGHLAKSLEWLELCQIGVGLVSFSEPLELEVDAWKKQKRLLPHAVRVSNCIDEGYMNENGESVEIPIRPDQLHSLGHILKDEQGQRAERMLLRALQGYEKALGPDHTATLDTVNNLGNLYAEQERLDDAERMYQRALQGKEQVWGVDHTSVLGTVNHLGLVYRSQGKLDEAEQMFQRALQGFQKAQVLDHASAIQTVANLGTLYAEQGKPDEAERMFKRALQGFKKTQEPEYISISNMFANLGHLYKRQSKLDEAERMLRRALQGYEKARGPDHTSTLNTVSELGNIYTEQGNLDKATQMHQRALRGFEKKLGPDHISTFDPLIQLGNIYTSQEKFDEAERIYQQALQGLEKIQGPYDTKTLDTIHNLGSLYASKGNTEEAEQMFQQALQGFEKSLGPDHTATLDTVNNLGKLYVEQGKLDEADQIYQRALLGFEKTSGPDHTLTLGAVNNLGNLYVKQGKPVEAERMYQRALEGLEKTWGPTHKKTLVPVTSLGSLYIGQGKLDEAERMYQRVLKETEKAQGLFHTSTLNTVSTLGHLYAQQDKLNEAERMFQRALQGYEKSAGHTGIMMLKPVFNTMWNLAIVSGRLGRKEVSLELFQKALTGYQRVFGEENPRYREFRDSLAAQANGEDKERAAAVTSLNQRVQSAYRRRQLAMMDSNQNR